MEPAKDIILNREWQKPSAEKAAENTILSRFGSLALAFPDSSISSEDSRILAIQCPKSSNKLQGRLNIPSFHV